METNDYAWDNRSDVTPIDGQALPGRFALTAPQVVMRSSGEILLIDPHAAGTWETWMFPYASLVLTADQVRTLLATKAIDDHPIFHLDAESTLGDLTAALHELRESLRPEYEEAIKEGVNNVLPQLQSGWSTNVFYENYSLKYSQSSNSYTAYDFEYFLNRAEPKSLDVPHVWVTPESLMKIVDPTTEFKGKVVSSNVLEAIPAILKL